MLRTCSDTDRIRYYWTDPKKVADMHRLIANLQKNTLPGTVVSQSFTGLEFGDISIAPTSVIETHVPRCNSRDFEVAVFRTES